MKSYAIVNIEVLDPALFAEYGPRMAQLLKRWGARYLARGGEAEHIEGKWQPSRPVIIEYPSPEVHVLAVASPEYQELKHLRDRSARCDIVHIRGVDDPF